MMRLFIGLGLDGGVKETLWDIVSGLRVQGQFTPKENYHITMAFLGMREERQVKPIERIAAAAAREHSQQALTVNGLGFFGRRENALLHAKLTPSQPLSALSDTLRRLLAGAGEDFDQKPFIPHITLARKADLTAVNLRAPFPPISVAVDKLTLYHSTRVQGELRYIPIFEAAFKAE